MADIAASVLARLKTRQKKVDEAISFVCNSSVKKSSYVAWKNRNIRKILY